MRAQAFLMLFLLAFLSKSALLLMLSAYGHNFFGGGNDANYYNAYAIGELRVAVNVWPVLLRQLNNIGLYSRDGITWALTFLGVLAIPFLTARLSVIKDSLAKGRIFWFVVVIVSIYPTLFYYTLDVYRDVFMVFVFLLGTVAVKNFIENNRLSRRWWLSGAIVIIAAFLFLLREYLGVALLAAFFGFWFFSFRRVPLTIYFVCYLAALNVFYALGFLEPIMAYRSLFGETLTGGSNLGIQFGSAIMFLPDFVRSFGYQMLGLYLPNMASLLILVLESVPFMVALIYLIRNRRHSNKFVDFLVLFFVFYSTVWLLGNGNLGTAARLRMFSYLSILIACAVVYQRKRQLLLSSRAG